MGDAQDYAFVDSRLEKEPNSFQHRARDLVHPCLMWTLQRESTQRIFREQQFSTMRIKLTLVSSLFSWLLVDTE